MANMSYCRFENTLNDFRDCLRVLQEEGLEDLSKSELECAKKLAHLADNFGSVYAECESYVEYES